MKNKHISLIIIIYCSVLAISTILYYIIPKQSIVNTSLGDKYQGSTYSKEDTKKVIKELKSKKLLDRYHVGSYKVDKEALELKGSNRIKQIIVERKSTNDNNIEVYSLIDPALVWRKGIQNVYALPNIAMDSSKLTINYWKSSFEFHHFSKNNTITQFFVNGADEDISVFNRSKFGKDNMDAFNYMDFSQFDHSPESIIYIQIPKDLKIDGDYEDID